MIRFDKYQQGKALAEGGGTTAVWYAKAVQLYSMSTSEFVENIANLGSSAYSRGELKGVALDLGRAIAQMMINGNKVHIDGLGTFTPTIRNDKKNLKTSEEVRRGDLYAVATFTPDADFSAILANANFVQVSKGSGDDSDGATYTVAYSNPAAGTLRFVPSEPGLLEEITAADVTCTLNGSSAGTISLGADYIDVTGLSAGTYNVQLKIRSTATYAAYSKSWTNVAISGSVSPTSYTVEVAEPTVYINGTNALIPSNNAWDSWTDLSNLSTLVKGGVDIKASAQLIEVGGHKRISFPAGSTAGDVTVSFQIEAFGAFSAVEDSVTFEVSTNPDSGNDGD